MEPALAGLKIAESDLLPKILEVQE
jgi:hypothetical protein